MKRILGIITLLLVLSGMAALAPQPVAAQQGAVWYTQFFNNPQPCVTCLTKSV